MKYRIKRYRRAALKWAETCVTGIFLICVLTFVVQIVILVIDSLRGSMLVSNSVGIGMLLFWLLGGFPSLILRDGIVEYRKRLSNSCCKTS